MIRASAQPPRPTGFVSVLQEHDSTIPPTGSPHFLLVSQFQTLVWIRALCEMFAPRTSSTLPLHDHGAGRTSFLNQGALLLMRRETAQQVLQSLQSTVWHTKLPSAAGPALPDNCPSRHPGSKRVTAERTREAWHTVQLYWVRLPPPERQLAAGPSRTAVKAACGASCQARLQTSSRHGAHGCGIGLLQSFPTPRCAAG